MARKTISKEIREKVYQKYDGHCAYCGCEITMKEMQADHLIPVNFGGVNEYDNYMPACRQCNFYKGSFLLKFFRHQMKTLHERIRKPFIYRLGLKFGIVQEPVPFDGKFYFEKKSEVKA